VNDRRSAWDMRADGTYAQRQAAGKRRDTEPGSQEALIRLAEKRFKTATRLRKRTAQTPGSGISAEPCRRTCCPPAWGFPNSSSGWPRSAPSMRALTGRAASRSWTRSTGACTGRAGPWSAPATTPAAGCACAARRGPADRAAGGPAIRFARDLPAGAMRDRLEPALHPRALLAIAAAAVTEIPIAVRSAPGRTVARLVFSSLRVGPRMPSRRCRCVPC